MEIFAVIRNDHERLRGMIRELCDASNASEQRRDALFTPFKTELTAHHQAEEAVLYAHMKDIEETRKEVLEALNEHHLVVVLLDELAIMPKGSDEWFAKFEVLRELVEHHLKEEEDEFFAAAREVIDDARAQELGRQMNTKRSAGVESLQPIA